MDNELIEVKMGKQDWDKVIEAMKYLSNFSSTALDTTSDEFAFLGDSISDAVLAS